MEIEDFLKLSLNADENAIKMTHLASSLHIDDAQRVILGIETLMATKDEERILRYLQENPTG